MSDAPDLADLLRSDPVAFVQFNDAQVRFLTAMREPKFESLTCVLMLKGNRAGGSYGLVSAWSAIMFGSRHKVARGSPFGEKWPFRKAARLSAPIASLEDKGPIQTAMKELFPAGKWSQSKGSGHGYHSQGSAGAWTFQMTTYDQAGIQQAGANLGLVLLTEPPPQSTFTECITRLSGNGMLIAEFTRLDMADFIDEYVEAGALMLDGRAVGEVRVVTADIEDSCREHHHGHQAHSAIEATIAAWPSEEREARKTGKSLKLSGRIYPKWGDANELAAPSEWHQEMWDKGMVRIANVIDPADARPWAISWFAMYPNDDVIAFMEWPPFDFEPCKQSPVSDDEDYRDLILEAEAGIGRAVDVRIMDGIFGNAPGKGNARSLRTRLAGPCRECMRRAGRGEYEDLDERSEAYVLAAQQCAHRLSYLNSPVYQGSVRDGHMLLRPMIGDPAKNIRPKFYAVAPATSNFCRGMRSYAYKIEKSPDREKREKPQLVYKDFPDTAAFLVLKGAHKWPQEAPPPPMPGPRKLWTLRAKPKA